MTYELDKLDRQIISALQNDARKAFTEIAEVLGVSGGTIHVRMDKLRQAGVVKGSRLLVDEAAIGYSICAFIGINLNNAGDYPKVIKRLQGIPRIVEAYYSTGAYNIFTKIYAKDIGDLHQFLLELQSIKEVQTTETIMVLDTPIDRDLVIGEEDGPELKTGFGERSS